MTASPKLQGLIERFQAEFPFYAEKLLRIRTKGGEIKPLQLNRAQLHLASLLAAQEAETGRVRLLVLKGRQQGISTFIQAWFFWRIAHERGKRAFILTHEQAASDNLFEMAQRFHSQLPDWIRPSTGASNARELYFENLDSGYQVATAGTRDTGRSATAQYFHGSEVAFWPNGDSHMAALGQVVPDQPGTVIVLESTANGLGNLFHRLWQEAQKGASDYRTVFIPWFWSDDYWRTPPAGWQRTEEENQYARAHGLNDGQLAWRRAKIAGDFAGDESRFRQEYPSTAAEAFVLVGHEPFIAPGLVLDARACRQVPDSGPLIIGVDPARFGDDSTAIIRRRGRRVLPQLERLHKLDTMQVAGRIAALIRDESPDRVFLDMGGLGAGVYDRLRELGFGTVLSGINFSWRPNQEERYANKRAEMWGELREWLRSPPCSLPPDDALLADLTGPQYSYDSQGRLKLESKDDLRKRGLKSPDLGDALALTFAQPVAWTTPHNPNQYYPGARTIFDVFWDAEPQGESLSDTYPQLSPDDDDRTGFHTG